MQTPTIMVYQKFSDEIIVLHQAYLTCIWASTRVDMDTFATSTACCTMTSDL